MTKNKTNSIRLLVSCVDPRCHDHISKDQQPNTYSLRMPGAVTFFGLLGMWVITLFNKIEVAEVKFVPHTDCAWEKIFLPKGIRNKAWPQTKILAPLARLLFSCPVNIEVQELQS